MTPGHSLFDAKGVGSINENFSDVEFRILSPDRRIHCMPIYEQINMRPNA